jgi:hypothetical protein
MVNELSHLIVKKILTFFYGKGPPVGQKLTKIFFQQDRTIHTPFDSPWRV